MWINPAVAKFYNIVSNNTASAARKAGNAAQSVSKPVLENLTPDDVNLLRMYSLGASYRSGITKPEMDELFAKDGVDFIVSAYELLCEKFMLSKPLRPGLRTEHLDNAVMQYAYPYHTITISTNPEQLENVDNMHFFGILRHEFQHCIQNLKILSHETFGEKAVDFYIKHVAKRDKQTFDSILSTPIKDIMDSENDGNQIQKILMLKFMSENNPKGYEEFLENNLAEYKQQIGAFRENVVKSWGVIKEDSKESELVKEYFKSFMEDTYFNTDGTVNIGKYLDTVTEQEAFLAGEIAECDARGICFFKKMKGNLAKFQNNPELIKNIKKQISESGVE